MEVPRFFACREGWLCMQEVNKYFGFTCDFIFIYFPWIGVWAFFEFKCFVGCFDIHIFLEVVLDLGENLLYISFGIKRTADLSLLFYIV